MAKERLAVITGAGTRLGIPRTLSLRGARATSQVRKVGGSGVGVSSRVTIMWGEFVPTRLARALRRPLEMVP